MDKRLIVFASLLGALILFTLVSASGGEKGDEKKPPKQFPESRIVGGTIADENEYPWQVALVSSSDANPRQGQFCGGSLIADDWVLTAAHCLFNRDGSAVLPNTIDAVMGVNQLSQGPSVGSIGQRRSVAQIITHPNYDDITSDNDIALLQLASPAALSCAVNIIEPATSADAAQFGDGAISIITGWGDITDGAQAGSDDLREVAVPLVSNNTCRSSYGNQITDNMICAGLAVGGRDSCQGDSGGPLIVSNGQGGFIQAGVVSWGNGCASPNFYGVYARVERYENWINSTMTSQKLKSSAPLTIDLAQMANEIFMPIIPNDIHAGYQCTLGSVELPPTNPPTPTPIPGNEGPDSSDIPDAILITVDQVVSGAVVRPGDTDDVYAINLTSGQRIEVVMSGGGSGDADLYLYPPTATTVYSTNQHIQFSDNIGQDEYLTWDIDQTGTWYIDIYAYEGIATYEFRVTTN